MNDVKPAHAACSGLGHVSAVQLATCSATASEHADGLELQRTAELRWDPGGPLPFNIRFLADRHAAGGQRGFPDDRKRSGGRQDQFNMQHVVFEVPTQTVRTAASVPGQLRKQETGRFSSHLTIPHEPSFPLLNVKVPPRLNGDNVAGDRMNLK